MQDKCPGCHSQPLPGGWQSNVWITSQLMQTVGTDDFSYHCSTFCNYSRLHVSLAPSCQEMYQASTTPGLQSTMPSACFDCSVCMLSGSKHQEVSMLRHITCVRLCCKENKVMYTSRVPGVPKKQVLVIVGSSATGVNTGVAPLVKRNQRFLDGQRGHPSQEVEWASCLVISACMCGREGS